MDNMDQYRAANVYRLVKVFLLEMLMQHSDQAEINFTQKNGKFNEWERMLEEKGTHLFLVAVTLASIWLYLGDL